MEKKRTKRFILIIKDEDIIEAYKSVSHVINHTDAPIVVIRKSGRLLKQQRKRNEDE